MTKVSSPAEARQDFVGGLGLGANSNIVDVMWLDRSQQASRNHLPRLPHRLKWSHVVLDRSKWDRSKWDYGA